jgi:putative endonuclease
MQSRTCCVYVLANHGGPLYTGVTGDLFRRVWQHLSGTGSKLTARYKLNRLIWFEESDDATAAIRREKQIKAWRRKWKIDLVKANNGDWADLAAGWYEIEGGSKSSPE